MKPELNCCFGKRSNQCVYESIEKLKCCTELDFQNSDIFKNDYNLEIILELESCLHFEKMSSVDSSKAISIFLNLQMT